MLAIGVDIGGTATRVGVVAGDLTLVAVEHFSTGSDFEGLCNDVAGGIASTLSQAGLRDGRSAPVAIAIPGLMDATTDRIRRAVNLPFIEGRSPVDLLPQSLQSNSIVVRDAEAATWGEYSARKDRPRRFAHLRLGTGTACGVVVDGERIELKRSVDRHADVLVYNRSHNAALCKCGQRGCLEAIASRGALCARSREHGFGDSLAGLARLVLKGDSRAVDLVEAVSRAVAVVVKQLVGEYGVELVALGGGVVAELPQILEGVQRDAGKTSSVRVQGSLLGDDAGVVGAGMMAAC